MWILCRLGPYGMKRTKRQYKIMIDRHSAQGSTACEKRALMAVCLYAGAQILDAGGNEVHVLNVGGVSLNPDAKARIALRHLPDIFLRITSGSEVEIRYVNGSVKGRGIAQLILDELKEFYTGLHDQIIFPVGKPDLLARVPSYGIALALNTSTSDAEMAAPGYATLGAAIARAILKALDLII